MAGIVSPEDRVLVFRNNAGAVALMLVSARTVGARIEALIAEGLVVVDVAKSWEAAHRAASDARGECAVCHMTGGSHRCERHAAEELVGALVASVVRYKAPRARNGRVA